MKRLPAEYGLAPPSPRPNGACGPGSATVEVDSLAPEAWDRLIGDFDDIALEQTACFADGQWGPARTSRLLLRRDGIPVAGACLALLTVPGLRRGLAYLRFGPFWRRRNAMPEPELYRAVVAALVAEYCERRGHCLTVMPRPNPVHYAAECAILDELGFAVRRLWRDPNRYLVDLSLDETAQMGSFKQKWRYNLRQALKNGIEVRLGESERDLAAFYALHAAMVGRKRLCDSDPLHLLPDLSARLPARMRPRLVLACHEGRPVVGAVVAVLGDTAYYVFGASDETALRLKAGYALQWWILRRLSDLGVRWYDLGGEVLDPGLRQFKRGLVGRSGAVLAMRGEYDRWTGAYGRVVADVIYGLREAKRTVRSLRYGG